MARSFGKLAAVIGSTLTALSLAGSVDKPATLSKSIFAPEIRRCTDAGKRQYSAGSYLVARDLFLRAASLSQQAGDPRAASVNWSNAGSCSLVTMDYRHALADFLRAREFARKSPNSAPLAITLNNLASLYLQMGDPGAALRVAQEGLSAPAAIADPTVRAKLRLQFAGALTRLHQFDRAKTVYRAAVDDLEDRGDLGTAAVALDNLGNAALDADRLDEAENALSEGLLLVRIHHLNSSANVLRGLAEVKSRRGDLPSARALFDASVAAPQSLTPRWLIYAARARFRLDHGDVPGAWTDFLEARRLTARLRANTVPADRDRIALESGLSRVSEGLVDAGNRLARQTADPALLAVTFDAVEQDRLWSLRALAPAPDDWRKHLPPRYWDLLARYQSAERSLMARSSAEIESQASDLQLQLQAVEAEAAPASASQPAQSALAHVRGALDARSVLFSFQITRSSGWLWAVDRNGVDAYPIPHPENLESRVTNFALAVRQDDPVALALGSQLYRDLFGAVPAAYLHHARWLLELDGPLFDLPFAALVVHIDRAKTDIRKNEPTYLVERAALQAIPGALMLNPPAPSLAGGFLGIGDPIYNAADPRFTGDHTNKQAVTLARLPATANEVQACALAFGAPHTRILTGVDAGIATVRAALLGPPAPLPGVIHFATHIVTAPNDRSSGLIALGLDPAGNLGLIGPTEIVAHPVSAGLVVLNGCHSGQGAALPGAGLMGLTRAWIGAGARSVLATRWDIPDEAGIFQMVGFYRTLHADPERGPAFALQQAQLASLNKYRSDRKILRRENDDSPGTAAVWAAYFLLGTE